MDKELIIGPQYNLEGIYVKGLCTFRRQMVHFDLKYFSTPWLYCIATCGAIFMPHAIVGKDNFDSRKWSPIVDY